MRTIVNRREGLEPTISPPVEEKALAKFVAYHGALIRPVRVKYIGLKAFSLARRREAANRPSKPSGKN
jgi:hypothetical protein